MAVKQMQIKGGGYLISLDGAPVAPPPWVKAATTQRSTPPPARAPGPGEERYHPAVVPAEMSTFAEGVLSQVCADLDIARPHLAWFAPESDATQRYRLHYGKADLPG